MKINKTNQIINIYENTINNKVKLNKKNKGKDEVEISEKARDYQFAMGKLKEVPDIRYEKVDKIKREIQSGTYNVSGKEIVDKMYENIEFDKRI
ncbi:MAG: flagellar biosynthesis anti-sigma factor FlgM [Tissierellia bacterium]|nr:flagellar biosynthesis anti-sigma factor FlgM [Tissierellia bacterium]